MTEQWKDIPGYEGAYQASTEGQVRSKDRTVVQRNRWGGSHIKMVPSQIIAPNRYHKGYASVVLYDINHESKRYEVHRLIAETFIGPKPDGHHTHHINEDKTDNRVTNLRYEKAGHHVAIHVSGERCHSAQLTERQVIEIRVLLQSGHTLTSLAEQFKMSKGAISHIKQGRSWKHLGRPS